MACIISIEPGTAGGTGATRYPQRRGQAVGEERRGRSNTTPIELRAGALYPITPTIKNITAGLTVRWETGDAVGRFQPLSLFPNAEAII
jgi:hypothetical protein